MFRKAVQTPEMWALAYELPTGGYAFMVLSANCQIRLNDEPQFEHLASLLFAMQTIAPLEEWSEEIFDRLALN